MILIIDEQTELDDPLVRLLERVGYRVQVIHQQEEAIGFIEAVRPGLIIVDLMDRKMSGLSLVRQLKGKARFAEIPVLVYTSLADPKLCPTVMRLGAGDCLIKGEFALMEVLACINRLYKETAAPATFDSVEEEEQSLKIPVNGKEYRPWSSDGRMRVQKALAESQAQILRATAVLNESHRLVSRTPPTVANRAALSLRTKRRPVHSESGSPARARGFDK